MSDNTQNKKAWSSPEVTVHGGVEELTLEQKLKDIGNGDDFSSNISSD